MLLCCVSHQDTKPPSHQHTNTNTLAHTNILYYWVSEYKCYVTRITSTNPSHNQHGFGSRLCAISDCMYSARYLHAGAFFAKRQHAQYTCVIQISFLNMMVVESNLALSYIRNVRYQWRFFSAYAIFLCKLSLNGSFSWFWSFELSRLGAVC